MEQCWLVVNYPQEQNLAIFFNQKQKFLIEENTGEYVVCKFVDILFKPQCATTFLQV